MASKRYWVYENGYLRGPFYVKDLVARDDFSISMMICPDGDHIWKKVHEISEIAPILSELAHAEILASGDYLPEPLSTENMSIADADTKKTDLA